MLSFLDEFSGYHQIPMYPPDAKKTSFITPTPQRAFMLQCNPIQVKECWGHLLETVTKMFRPLLEKNMEVYIDDMLVKSKERPNHATHL